MRLRLLLILRVNCAARLVEEVLLPLRVPFAQHPHEMTAGVQTEWARLARQLHTCFLGSPVSFAVVTGVAAGNQILPGRFARS